MGELLSFVVTCRLQSFTNPGSGKVCHQQEDMLESREVSLAKKKNKTNINPCILPTSLDTKCLLMHLKMFQLSKESFHPTAFSTLFSILQFLQLYSAFWCFYLFPSHYLLVGQHLTWLSQGQCNLMTTSGHKTH